MTMRENRLEIRSNVRALMPWLKGPLLAAYVRAFIEHGEPELAWAAVRQTDEYETVFAGNRREDGTVRWDELTYMSIKEDFQDTIRSVGVNPRVFEGKYRLLFEGNKSPAEFASQIDAIYERVALGGQEVEDAYFDRLGIVNGNRAALIASLIDNDIHDALLDKRITVAEITGEAATQGFDVGDLAERLEEADFNRAGARDLFGTAADLVPELSVLAQRHADPDDDFDINEFAAAAAFNDPDQSRRIRRLLSQERASFQQSGALGVRTDQRTGGLTGLDAR